MSASQPLNDEVYENVPEEFVNLSVSNNIINNNQANDDYVSSESQNSKVTKTSQSNNNIESRKEPETINDLMNQKDAVYATPLRKSDRHKSSRKSPEGGKISNLNHHRNNNNGVSNDPELQNLMDRTYLNSELGENRIKDFLKDTAYMHKKIEPPGKEHIGSSFSYLARKEHFVNLVNQNVLKDQHFTEEDATDALKVDSNLEGDLITLDDSIEPCGDLAETEKLINNLVNFQAKIASEKAQSNFATPSFPTKRLMTTTASINLNREWVLKKIAMSLEQKAFKKLPPTLPENVAGINQQQLMQNSNLPVVGYLVLGSSGSGKTSICDDIINGTNGTKGLLNRRLLSFYFVNSQDPDCQSLSFFIRNMVLQILSFSSLWNKSDTDTGIKRDELATNENSHKNESPPIDKEIEELTQNEVEVDEVDATETKSKIIRQQSAPTDNTEVPDSTKYTTHPPLLKQLENVVSKDESERSKNEKLSPSKKSKIPVKISQKSPKTTSSQAIVEASNGTEDSIQTGGGEGIADINDQKLEEDIAKELQETIQEDEQPEQSKDDEKVKEDEEPNSERPPPLPKLKDCRTILADSYFNMILQNPEIFESLIIDNIEKNPDDCFKKAILFPLLELVPPKSAQLMLIDSIDENYLNDGTLITTLNKKSNTKSRNIAELLSNHIHLLPKWLFLVCTAKKQNKHITKLFSGFKKLTLDDLRKSHVVKDIQQYIINRLNVDFRGINLNKEIIEALNQLVLKSNGVLLFVERIFNGILKSYFTFREIKLMPCTLYGCYLYEFQKSFNRKQFSKIRPILNILLACNNYADKSFVFDCLRTHNYTIDYEEYQKRLEIMNNILETDEQGSRIKIKISSSWLLDIKFCTSKFLCDLNEGHLMIAMHYTLTSDQLCPNKVREYVYHLIKSAEYLSTKNGQLDVLLILLESKANLSDCFYTNALNCCKSCENEFVNDLNQTQRTRKMIQQHLGGQLAGDFSGFIGDFFKPSLPTEPKLLKLLMETGINNLDSQLSCESSMMNSPLPSDKSQTVDSELAELLISSEKSCAVEHKVTNLDASTDEPVVDNSNQYERIDIELHKGKAFIHILANDGNHALMERALRACKGPIDLEIEDHNGQTALNIAARNGHIDVVRLLLEYNWVRKCNKKNFLSF